MQPGIPTAAQTFRSSQTEIADPTSVDGGAATSNKGMLLHRREPRNVEKRRKKKKKKSAGNWRSRRSSEYRATSSNYRRILCFTEREGGRGRGSERVFESRMLSWKCGDGRYLIEIKSVHQITGGIRTKRKRIGRSVDDLWGQWVYSISMAEGKVFSSLREGNNDS